MSNPALKKPDSSISVYSGKKFYRVDFSGMDLKAKDLRRATFMHCSFDNADLSEADCTGTEFFGSTFRETNCRNTNFRDARLHKTVFAPSDFFGMTMTFACQTYKDMQISREVWEGYLHFALDLMKPPTEDGFDPRDVLIQAIGMERFAELSQKFNARTI